MFNGSENLPGDYFNYLQQIGATDYNGTTSFDRTNYFETVPTGALDRALFMESDRMGHLLGAINQGMLDNQRGVVQNEKRQGDNRPGGLVVLRGAGEPVPRRPPLSSHDDRLDGRPRRGQPARRQAAGSATNTAPTMPCWCWPATSTPPSRAPAGREIFRRDPARPGQQSGPGRGPDPGRAQVDGDEGPRRDDQRVALLGRAGPARPQLVALDVGGSVLGGLASSRLDEVLVRDEKLAVSVSAGLYAFQRVGIFYVTATVKPGVDPAVVEKRLDELVAEYHRQGPTDGRGPARAASAKSAAGFAGWSRSAASAARR